MHRILITSIMTVALALACDDPFAALLRPVPDVPRDVTLFDFRTGRLQDPSAFDTVRELTARPDQTNQWDFLYRVTEEGESQLVPFGAVTDSSSDAGLLAMSQSFEGITMAPLRGYEIKDPVPIEEGDVLVVRSRVDPTSFLVCRYYGKIQILEIDAAGPTVTFMHLGNPNCSDRVLVPGEHGDF